MLIIPAKMPRPHVIVLRAPATHAGVNAFLFALQVQAMSMMQMPPQNAQNIPAAITGRALLQVIVDARTPPMRIMAMPAGA